MVKSIVMNTEENQYIISLYDESLGEFILKNKFNSDSITDICGAIEIKVNIDRRNLPQVINEFNSKYSIGCIFVLPGKRRDGKCSIIRSLMSSKEIRRRIALKVFL
jgi:hypothetical protein